MSSRAIAAREELETTHWSVVDEWGNAVAATTTINNIFGSGAFVSESGIFLSDTMDDFAAEPGREDQWGLVSGEANAIAGGKRPLSSMTPFILLDREQQLLMVAGSRGGPRIISNVLQLVTNVVDHGMSVTDAISAPRIHHQGSPDQLRYELGGFHPAVIDSLQAIGYTRSPRTAPTHCRTWEEPLR
jgi:gamma-glutamyltranspeptidase / glutathione hydrolase